MGSISSPTNTRILGNISPTQEQGNIANQAGQATASREVTLHDGAKSEGSLPNHKQQIKGETRNCCSSHFHRYDLRLIRNRGGIGPLLFRSLLSCRISEHYNTAANAVDRTATRHKLGRRIRATKASNPRYEKISWRRWYHSFYPTAMC